MREAIRLDHHYVGTEHLLLALLGEDGAGGRVLRDAGVDAARAETSILADLAKMLSPDPPAA